MADKEMLYDAAIDCVAEGRLDDAIAKYQEALRVDPAYLDAWHGLSMAYAEKGLLEDAIAAGKKLVELDPDDELAYTNLSRFYQQLGNVPEAEAWAAKARLFDWKRQLAESDGEKK
jgi:superkiller protein 3